MVFLAASRLAVAIHVCYWLAIAPVQRIWLAIERPIEGLGYTVI